MLRTIASAAKLNYMKTDPCWKNGGKKCTYFQSTWMKTWFYLGNFIQISYGQFTRRLSPYQQLARHGPLALEGILISPSSHTCVYENARTGRTSYIYLEQLRNLQKSNRLVAYSNAWSRVRVAISHPVCDQWWTFMLIATHCSCSATNILIFPLSGEGWQQLLWWNRRQIADKAPCRFIASATSLFAFCSSSYHSKYTVAYLAKNGWIKLVAGSILLYRPRLLIGVWSWSPRWRHSNSRG